MVAMSDTFADQRVLPWKKELALSEIIISIQLYIENMMYYLCIEVSELEHSLLTVVIHEQKYSHSMGSNSAR